MLFCLQTIINNNSVIFFDNSYENMLPNLGSNTYKRALVILDDFCYWLSTFLRYMLPKHMYLLPYTLATPPHRCIGIDFSNVYLDFWQHIYVLLKGCPPCSVASTR